MTRDEKLAHLATCGGRRPDALIEDGWAWCWFVSCHHVDLTEPVGGVPEVTARPPRGRAALRKKWGAEQIEAFRVDWTHGVPRSVMARTYGLHREDSVSSLAARLRKDGVPLPLRIAARPSAKPSTAQMRAHQSMMTGAYKRSPARGF